jgi:hypothetical protein
MISLDCKPGANTFHVLAYSAVDYQPLLHDILGLQAWSEYFPCRTLLSWYFQLLLHDILGLQAWSEYFHVLPYSAVDYQPLLHDLLGLQAWSEYFPCLTQLSWTASCCKTVKNSCRTLPYAA